MSQVFDGVWRKSSRCESAACVEIADLSPAVGVRNSTAPQTSLAISAEAFREFLAGVKLGEFDRA